jgi:O-methyltransferase/aklanonic acid methyltransferase
VESGKVWLAEAFSRAAASYDATIPFFATFARDVLERAELRPGERVLDVGCGPGTLTVPAGHAVGPQGRVVGVDIAPGMIDALLANAEQAGLQNVEGRVDDIESLTEPDCAYDAVIASYVFQFVYRPARCAGHLRRVLVDGGRISIAALHYQALLWDFVQDLLQVYLMRVRKPVRPPPPPYNLVEILESAGFVGVEREIVPHEFVLADADAWWAFAMSHGQRVIFDALDDADRERFRSKIVERLADHTTARGIPLRCEASLVVGWRR